MENPVHFFADDIEFTLPQADLTSSWLLQQAKSYGRSIGAINYIFCSDERLLQLNQTYLDHHDYTDILTFPNADPGEEKLQADIYVSIDRIRENAQTYGASVAEELHRVMVHGLLHLIGFDDHGKAAKAEMRKAEEDALSKRPAPLLSIMI